MSSPVGRTRGSSQRFPRQSIRILEDWLLQNRDSPYPEWHDQNILKAKTGLKRSQIINWFANARKRRRVQGLESAKSRPSPGSVAAATASLLTTLQPAPPLPLFPMLANLHPFERWLHLSMEEESASLTAIQEAVRALDQSTKDNAVEGITGPRAVANMGHFQVPTKSQNWQYFRKCESSVSSMEIRSYAANVRSVKEEQWRDPYKPQADSVPSNKCLRRHRHRYLPQSTTKSHSTLQWRDGDRSEASAPFTKPRTRNFQCTFCDYTFRKKHDWQRHEKSQHLPLERWTCCLHGGVSVDAATNQITCVFCGISDPAPAHIHNHGYTQCIERPIAERTFYRKDHLRQHLRRMHHVTSMTPSMEKWKSVVIAVQSRCGFCSVDLDTWHARTEHLAEHFLDGAVMTEWQGDWGFDSATLAKLEGAVLPMARRRRADQNTALKPLAQQDIALDLIPRGDDSNGYSPSTQLDLDSFWDELSASADAANSHPNDLFEASTAQGDGIVWDWPDYPVSQSRGNETSCQSLLPNGIFDTYTAQGGSVVLDWPDYPSSHSDGNGAFYGSSVPYSDSSSVMPDIPLCNAGAAPAVDPELCLGTYNPFSSNDLASSWELGGYSGTGCQNLEASLDAGAAWLELFEAEPQLGAEDSVLLDQDFWLYA
ncbi:hypothetical protein CC79DRAFT_1353480 [Sarocladium strictum]